MLSARDIREFRGFLRNATDRQVQGIYDKEKSAGRDDYAELAVAEAESRGIFLELSDDDAHSTKKTRGGQKSPEQLDREIAEVLAKKPGSHTGRHHSTMRGSYPFDLIPGDVVTRKDIKGRKKYRVSHLGDSGSFVQVYAREVGSGRGDIVTFDRSQLRLANSDDALKGRSSRASRAHATVKGDVPGIAKWNMSAGGTGAAAGKHGYSYRGDIKGEYHISPYTTKSGRHAGYALKYAATGGPPRGSHSGLWHDLGTHRSPAGAAKAAREHYARSFA